MTADRYTPHVTAPTPQTEKAHDAQVPNRAGGFAEPVSQWTQLERFLVLGTEGGTYYAGAREMTRENAAAAVRCIRDDPVRALAKVAQVSNEGRAIRNDPALFVLALTLAESRGAAKPAGAVTTSADKPAVAASSDAMRSAFAIALPFVVRTGSHLLTLATMARKLGANLSGRGLRGVFGDILLRWASADKLVYQLAKYRNRSGATVGDFLRMTRPRLPQLPATRHGIASDEAKTERHREVAAAVLWSLGRPKPDGVELPRLLHACDDAHAAKDDPKRVAELVRQHQLTREMLPSDVLGKAEVWDALLDRMPIGAMVRNLGQMTRLGVVAPLSDGEGRVLAALADVDRIRKARLHPLAILVALRAYSRGRPMRGSGEGWTPAPRVVDALDRAFYAAFPTVKPTGKRVVLAVDVSGSMGSELSSLPLSSAEVAAAMALAVANVETSSHVLGFFREVRELGVSPGMRLDQVLDITRAATFGATDAGAVLRWVEQRRLEVDAIVTLTDNESWAGPEHVAEGLRRYRRERVAGLRAIAAATTATSYSILPDDDPLCLNVAGADASLPQLVSTFIAPERVEAEGDDDS